MKWGGGAAPHDPPPLATGLRRSGLTSNGIENDKYMGVDKYIPAAKWPIRPGFNGNLGSWNITNIFFFGGGGGSLYKGKKIMLNFQAAWES